MIDHLSTYATDYLKTRYFYASVFPKLGYSLQSEFQVELDTDFPNRRVCSFGENGRSTYWVIETSDRLDPRHIAFVAKSQEQVDSFYESAIRHGGTGNGKPGLRPAYHDNYYGAFVFDPDGNNIEAVFHGS